jgi:hypothetical protein
MLGFLLILFPFVLLGFVMVMGRVEKPLSQFDQDGWQKATD